jgi:hypothetical protein
VYGIVVITLALWGDRHWFKPIEFHILSVYELGLIVQRAYSTMCTSSPYMRNINFNQLLKYWIHFLMWKKKTDWLNILVRKFLFFYKQWDAVLLWVLTLFLYSKFKDQVWCCCSTGNFKKLNLNEKDRNSYFRFNRYMATVELHRQ